MKRRGCLDLFALNVYTCFASKNLRSFRKNTSHSAHRSLELKISSRLCRFLCIKKEGVNTFSFNGGNDEAVLDFLHARKVSQLNLRFKFAQFPRYPNFASLNTYGNPPNSQKRFLPLSFQPLKKEP